MAIRYMPLDRGAKKRKRRADRKQRIGFTCGAFDLKHAGHDLMFEEIRGRCDFLRVGLQTDPSADRPEKNAPVQTYEERLIQLRSCRYIDEIVVYDTEEDLYQYLAEHARTSGGDIDVRFVGADHQYSPFTGDELSIPVIFNSRNHGYSSSSLRRRIYLAEKAKREFAGQVEADESLMAAQ